MNKQLEAMRLQMQTKDTELEAARELTAAAETKAQEARAAAVAAEEGVEAKVPICCSSALSSTLFFAPSLPRLLIAVTLPFTAITSSRLYRC